MLTLRVRFVKEGPARFLSHLDTLRALERALRRSGLPLELTRGYSAHPRLAVAVALPLGMVGEDEYLDAGLAAPCAAADARRLASVLPEGLRLLEAAVLLEAKALEPRVAAADYRIALCPGPWDLVHLRRAADLLLAQASLPFARAKGLVDLRPGIRSADAAEHGGVLQLELRLTAGGHGTVRPEEVLKLLAEETAEGFALRTTAMHRRRLLAAAGDRLVPLREVAFAKGVEIYAHGDHGERGTLRGSGSPFGRWSAG
ncbi:MAG: TIGR03936 family radical SAM-associated protein [Thermaerobacter sp.]|nr:TIGR03936 family radical SAM-associated protein [Thermaerobacter sp.]